MSECCKEINDQEDEGVVKFVWISHHRSEVRMVEDVAVVVDSKGVTVDAQLHNRVRSVEVR